MKDSPEKMVQYFDDIGREFLLSRCCPLLGWIDRDDVFKVSFEAMYGDHGSEVQIATVIDTAKYCGIDITPEATETICSELIGKDTFTWSGSRTHWPDFWNDDMEQRFRSVGGHLLNRLLGYPEQA